ncbi:MAG: hypothetical protein GXO55_08755 [Chloroflexi bacterium]|nr:hypothetical protein [Chloroflexota bacterium]
MQERESFLIRVWFDGGCTPSQLRGEIQHVRTGYSRRFCGEEEMLRILHDWRALLQSEEAEENRHLEEVIS